jgi:hypothetical protein
MYAPESLENGSCPQPCNLKPKSLKKLILIPFLLIMGICCKSQDTKVLICMGTSSKSYHSHYCTGLKQCKASVEKVTISDAIKLKRGDPCDFCYGKGATNTRSSYSSGNQQSPGQCQAITQRGTRCSRNARSGGYCWQHGG